ncbi:MAG: sugar ABC transporter substrate-binding protein [Clostridium sp.]|nr:sugar ABC transporter substrate-binding protein [Clostridium sp.]
MTTPSQRFFPVMYLAIALCVCVPSYAAEQLEGKKLAFVIQDLSNPLWAQYARGIQELGESKGMSVTSLECKVNASTQIAQVENLIQEGVDAIVIHPAEPNALNAVAGEAREKGVKVISWDTPMKNSNVDFLLDNYILGKGIGQEAGRWINERLGGEAEVAILDYPSYPELIQRADGIADGIKEVAPNAVIVARTSAVNATEGMAKTETVLTANPDIKVIACIGDGGAIGANEAVKAAGKNTPDFGIFSCDATDEALSKIARNESIRMTMDTGTAEVTANDIITLVTKLLTDVPVDKAFMRSITPVTAANLDQYYTR